MPTLDEIRQLQNHIGLNLTDHTARLVLADMIDDYRGDHPEMPDLGAGYRVLGTMRRVPFLDPRDGNRYLTGVGPNHRTPTGVTSLLLCDELLDELELLPMVWARATDNPEWNDTYALNHYNDGILFFVSSTSSVVLLEEAYARAFGRVPKRTRERIVDAAPRWAGLWSRLFAKVDAAARRAATLDM